MNDRPTQPMTHPMLDGATASLPVVAPEIEARASITTDATRSREERVEAFEDIIDSEVGDTTLSRVRNIEREYGMRQLFVKFEGGNPTGTQKDRIAFAQAMDALRRGYDVLTAATCGNYGVAVALAADLAGLKSRIYVPTSFHTRRIQEMESFGATIVRTNGDYEEAVEESRAQAETHDLYDANPGGVNTPIQLHAYGEIANEIYDELRDAPAIVAVPVSNGTTLAGIYRGFLSLYRRGKTSRMPRLVAGSSFNKNPIVRAFLTNALSCMDLPQEKIRETVVNEPLINWHSIDGDHALDAIRETNGWAGHASDRSMLALSRVLREREGLNVLPAATAGLNVLLEAHRRHPLPGDRYVVILTGRKA